LILLLVSKRRDNNNSSNTAVVLVVVAHEVLANIESTGDTVRILLHALLVLRYYYDYMILPWTRHHQQGYKQQGMPHQACEEESRRRRGRVLFLAWLLVVLLVPLLVVY